ncbi:SOS response-associated peptidase [Candidatus Woesearchaeota archaeon]|nr:SOS response-associated peptidase [Candidatus Woesearchaeota archaeon]
MCGRFGITVDWVGIRDRFRVEVPEGSRQPRYNISPTQETPVILSESPARVSSVRWGLIPRWAKDPSIGSRLINARAGTIGAKPAFSTPFARQRCLVIADLFYEWKRVGSRIVPFCFRRPDRRPFAFAGIYDRWKGLEPAARWYRTRSSPPARIGR